MKTIQLSLFLLLFSMHAFSQSDTLYINGEKVIATVKEVTTDAVKFSYPNEDLVNSVYKNSVQKIVFKSGRVQTFIEAIALKKVNSVDDYENVTITAVEGEIKGLFKIGDVSSKAKGTTALSNQERVKERAYRKLKIEAAMMGANVVYLTDQRTEGNKYGGYYQASSSAETNLTGVAYSNVLPNFNGFKSLVGANTQFLTSIRYKLWSSSSDVASEQFIKQFTINKISNENGLIVIDADLEGEKKATTYKVASFDEHGFDVFYNSKSTAYTVRIAF